LRSEPKESTTESRPDEEEALVHQLASQKISSHTSGEKKDSGERKTEKREKKSRKKIKEDRDEEEDETLAGGVGDESGEHEKKTEEEDEEEDYDGYDDVGWGGQAPVLGKDVKAMLDLVESSSEGECVYILCTCVYIHICMYIYTYVCIYICIHI